jgi:hypothetical protein
MPWAIKRVGHIYFILVGMAFFMPNRVGFSIWSVTLAWGVYEMVGRSYFPPHYGSAVHDYRNGAMIAVTAVVLYLGRYHLRHVVAVMFTGVKSEDDRLLRVSGWMVAAGAIGMFAWLQWAGVPMIWAAVFVFIGFMVSVLIARIVAETGMPFVRVTGLEPAYFMAMIPVGWITGATVYVAGFIAMIFPLGSRVSAAVMVSHAAALDEKTTPRQQIRIGYMMIGILAVGLVVCGAVHLYMGYTQPYMMDGSYASLNSFGANRLAGVQNSMLNWSRDFWPMPSNRFGHLMFGIALAGGLQLACMTIPKWPLHPVGLLLVGHYYGNLAWASVLIGWALKVTIIRYGGATGFQRAKPLFMGMIMGEIFSAVIWTAVPIALLASGEDPTNVGKIPLLPR